MCVRVEEGRLRTHCGLGALQSTHLLLSFVFCISNSCMYGISLGQLRMFNSLPVLASFRN